MHYKEEDKFIKNILDIYTLLTVKGADEMFLKVIFKKILNYKVSSYHFIPGFEIYNEALYDGKIDYQPIVYNSTPPEGIRPYFGNNIYIFLYEDSFIKEEDKFEFEKHNEKLAEKLAKTLTFPKDIPLELESTTDKLLEILEEYNKEKVLFIKLNNPEEKNITYKVIDRKIRFNTTPRKKQLAIHYLLEIYSNDEFLGHLILDGAPLIDVISVYDVEVFDGDTDKSINTGLSTLFTEDVTLERVYEELKYKEVVSWL